MQSDQNFSTILIIERNPEKRGLRDILKEAGYDLRCFRSARKAFKSAQSAPPDIILLDLKMTDAEGFEICRHLKADNSTKDIPVIFLSDSAAAQDKIQAFDAGGADYIVKPFHPTELLARVKTFLKFRETERKQRHLISNLESRLQGSNKKFFKCEEDYNRILRSAKEGIIITDSQLHVVFANEAISEMTKLRPEEIIGRESVEFIPEENKKEFWSRISMRKKGISEQYQFQILLPDGAKLWVQITSSPIMDQDNQFHGVVLFFSDIDKSVSEQKKLREAYEEIKLLKKRLESDNVYLRAEIKEEHNFNNIIGRSDAINYALFRLKQVSETNSTVVVLGETGTGKELFVRALHSISKRSARPLVKVDCAAMTEQLIESELFGHAKGAFTGAEQTRIGRFELAHKGTIFLDEIGELPLTSQAKLLRLLEEGEFERVGDSRTLKCDVRIIAATNRNISELVQQGKFRGDLWHRLNVFPITIPPLRKRKEDIPLLVKHFVDLLGRRIGKNIKRIPASVMEELTMYEWPGNVRELYHFLERSMILTTGSSLVLAERLAGSQSEKALPETLSHGEMEKKHLVQVLEQTNWVVEGPKGAASILKMHPNTLRYRMKKHGITRPNSA